MTRRELSVCLFQPEIPQNTGNIGRLCVGMNLTLHLIEPLGFDLNEKSLRRAGLDYWKYLNLKTHSDFDSYFQSLPNHTLQVISKFGKKDVFRSFIPKENSISIIFGKETTGFPKEISDYYQLERVAIPMLGQIRSFNLSNSVAMTSLIYLHRLGMV